ncbi:MAG: pyrroline-5-carboxylate reductase [Phycisphaerales bacterium]|nr:pyrroline-5-carboxylate reductase [Phycisphaerales bacterium]
MDHIPALGVLGAGPMGSAIVRGAIAGGRVNPADVLVVDALEQPRAAMSSLGCQVAEDVWALKGHSLLLLAIRPQDFAQCAGAASEQGPLWSATARLAVSVMAGLSTQAIAKTMGPATRVVRTMPNTAASIGKAVVGIAPGDTATADDLDTARHLMEGVGSTVDVNESQMHALTAVAGSGPAWVYLLAEAIEAEAVSLGLSDEQTAVLLRGMLTGASALFDQDARGPGALREAVTTPGGTTEAGLAAMQEGGFVEAVRAGVRAACRRGEALSG